jgi:nicotinamide-nucleotide amidase
MAMLRGLKKVTSSSCCVSITGIAGPTGGSDQKPVGLVFIGVNINESFAVQQFNFLGDRERIQTMSALSALDLLRKGLASSISAFN